MSLIFVGRLPRDIRVRELEDIFYKYGRIRHCSVKNGGYGFVEFEDPRDASDAIRYCDGMRCFGGRIAVEWARGKKTSNDDCFKCGKSGHWARDCTNESVNERNEYRRRDDKRSYRRSRSPASHRSKSPKRYGSHSPVRRSTSRIRNRSYSPRRSRSPVSQSPVRSPPRNDSAQTPSPPAI